MTKVSILTPTLNAMDNIQECMQSVIDQDYEDIEHVIADAGSTDGTFEYLLELSRQFPHRIKVIKSINDKGVGDGLNTALRNSTGSIIGWLDADDLLEINSISKIVEVFESSKHTDFIYGNCTIIDSSSKPIGEFIVRDFDKWEWVNRWHYIIFCGVYFRRQVVEKVGFVNSLGNDLDFYMRVAKKFTLERVDLDIARWRYHSASISHEDSARSRKIRYDRAKEDFYIVLKQKGSWFSPRSINFVLIFGKRCLSNKFAMNVSKFFVVEKLKSFLVHNVSNSNTYIDPTQSFFITLIKIAIKRIIARMKTAIKRILYKFIHLSTLLNRLLVILYFFRLEFRFQRKLRKRKKFYAQ